MSSLCLSLPTQGAEDPRAKREGNCKNVSSASSSNSSSPSKYVTIGSNPSSNPYETAQSVNEYLLMHYGTLKELMNFPQIQSTQLQASINFPRECAEICGKYVSLLPSSSSSAGVRILDLGCSVGRSSFELTRFASEVIGLDYSQAFIDVATKLQETGSAPYTIRTEGDLIQSAVARVPDVDRSRVRFIQGDACDLMASFPSTQFHIVLAANLLCRLPFPGRFLETVSKIIVTGGYLVMPSPYTWLEQYTPKDEWIGGYIDAKGNEVRSYDGIKSRLEDTGFFTFVEAFDLPFFIRETARKNQWSVSHVTVWKRTAKQN